MMASLAVVDLVVWTRGSCGSVLGLGLAVPFCLVLSEAVSSACSETM